MLADGTELHQLVGRAFVCLLLDFASQSSQTAVLHTAKKFHPTLYKLMDRGVHYILITYIF